MPPRRGSRTPLLKASTAAIVMPQRRRRHDRRGQERARRRVLVDLLGLDRAALGQLERLVAARRRGRPTATRRPQLGRRDQQQRLRRLAVGPVVVEGRCRCRARRRGSTSVHSSSSSPHCRAAGVERRRRSARCRAGGRRRCCWSAGNSSASQRVAGPREAGRRRARARRRAERAARASGSPAPGGAACSRTRATPYSHSSTGKSISVWSCR